MGTVLPCLRWVAIDESIRLLDLLFKSVAKLNILNMLHVEWSDHVYFVHPSTDVWVDITANTRPMYRSRYRPILDRYVGRHIDRHSTDVSTEISRSIY